MTLAHRIRHRFGNTFATRHPAPIFILGNQKSGTSAIALLLGEISGLTATNDLRREIGDQLILPIRAGQVPFSRLLRRNRLDFSRAIIKHPNLTLIYEELRQAFPRAKFAFVIREPSDNIRSILDRLDLPGTLDQIDSDRWSNLPAAWRAILQGDGLELASSRPAEVLAHRWNLIADVYLDRTQQMQLIRYEDFVADKVGTLRVLAESLGLRETKDISASVDRQYQPRGSHRGIDPWEFFGDNLEFITGICRVRMERFGYR
ncbi:MAG TPA: sulfotransferase [Acidimicrobiia bacterium]|nr:sulfotransferase [Acidimicrobiia bacterium]